MTASTPGLMDTYKNIPGTRPFMPLVRIDGAFEGDSRYAIGEAALTGVPHLNSVFDLEGKRGRLAKARANTILNRVLDYFREMREPGEIRNVRTVKVKEQVIIGKDFNPVTIELPDEALEAGADEAARVGAAIKALAKRGKTDPLWKFIGDSELAEQFARTMTKDAGRIELFAREAHGSKLNPKEVTADDLSRMFLDVSPDEVRRKAAAFLSAKQFRGKTRAGIKGTHKLSAREIEGGIHKLMTALNGTATSQPAPIAD